MCSASGYAVCNHSRLQHVAGVCCVTAVEEQQHLLQSANAMALRHAKSCRVARDLAGKV